MRENKISRYIVCIYIYIYIYICVDKILIRKIKSLIKNARISIRIAEQRNDH